ncbi:amidase domain-containing protein [Hathewaya histolytica]|uniref:amidase domain-containing protein n=1 Tax=Hathewaya histolytica TaxID=1498 RepID=UPI003B67ED17
MKDLSKEEMESVYFFIEQYFIKIYNSLKNLDIRSYEEFFYDSIDSLCSLKRNEMVLNTLINYRRDYPDENFLSEYDFSLYIKDIEKKDCIYKINIKERFKYRYNSLNVCTEGSNNHFFKLIRVNGVFKILNHENKDVFIKELNYIFFTALNDRKNLEQVQRRILFKSRYNRDYTLANLSFNNIETEKIGRENTLYKNDYLSSKYNSELERNLEENALYRSNSSWSNYNRESAVNYAKHWALKRNPKYLDFEDLGGDCTNFTSQCIHAGGIVMDLQQPYIWKYFTSQWNESSSRIGRSSSWTSVLHFRKYARENTEGGGLRAKVGVDMRTLQPGDIVQIENEHGTVIVENLYRGGRLIDFLIACHTSDRLNERLLLQWPNSKYPKTTIKIEGSYKW